MTKIKHLVPPLLFFAILLLGWESAVSVYALEPWMLPAPTVIWKELIDRFPSLTIDIVATMRIAVQGLSIGVLVGTLLALLLHLNRWVYNTLYPLLVITQNIPTITLAPLLILWFGFGDLPKLLIVALVCFFPITISLLSGFRQVDPILHQYLRITGTNRLQLFTKLELPSALPSLFAGLKLAATYSVMGAVISEWLGAEEGLGLVMTTAATSFRTSRVFVVILLIVVLSLIMVGVISLLEKWMIREQRQKKGRGNR
ncbi:ABC transporter permease [Risungbinella massiliensis]|uniref:ABC transporter permease n=1 Tax=Risungbinella massiliensis TaxID=1329796 RepID=UPI0005CBA6C0|nr:ABC transporter permease [Risungbinella massiliensis]